MSRRFSIETVFKAKDRIDPNPFIREIMVDIDKPVREVRVKKGCSVGRTTFLGPFLIECSIREVPYLKKRPLAVAIINA